MIVDNFIFLLLDPGDDEQFDQYENSFVASPREYLRVSPPQRLQECAKWNLRLPFHWQFPLASSAGNNWLLSDIKKNIPTLNAATFLFNEFKAVNRGLKFMIGELKSQGKLED